MILTLRVATARLGDIIRFFRQALCGWHRDETPVDWENANTIPSCPDCGKLLHLKACIRCHGSFVDFESEGFDDVMAAARVTLAGDLTCAMCLLDEETDDFTWDMTEASE